MIFVFFSVFFRRRFSSALRKAKKSSNMSQQDTESENFGPGSDDPLAPGERKRKGYKIFALHKELGLSDSPFEIGQDVSESDLVYDLARPAPPSVGGGLNSPQGGPPPPPHLCARMLGDCHALKACICRTALLKAHGEMKAHILATICPDFAMNLRRW